MLRRYWFSFVPTGRISSLNLGCGVTADSRIEAEEMIRRLVFPLLGEGEIQDVTENVDIRSLEQNHVLPNIGNPSVRGVWFPDLGLRP